MESTTSIDTNKRQNLKTTLEYLLYRIQVALNVGPRGFCLITGCPRSGTSAVNAWLGGHHHTARFVESRILVAAHRFVDEIKKFENLNRNSSDLIPMIRRNIFAFYGSKKLLWKKMLIDKEPLEPIAFPDKRYKEFLNNFQTIFPKAKLLFIVREPVATIWSMSQRQWGYSLTQKELKTFSIEDYVQNWNACAEIIKEFAPRKNVYVCRFENLISDPEEESHRIFDFLSIPYGKSFQPKPTSISAFSASDKDFILHETKRQRDMVLSVAKNG